MKLDYKNLIGLIVIGAILVAVSGCISTHNNTNNSTQNITQNNNSSVKNTTTEISATKAKALATQFTGMGVTLGTPKLTTFRGVKVWSVPVSTVGTNGYVDNIYINAVTGKRVQ